MKAPFPALLLVVLAFASSSSIRADVIVGFSGGNNTPLTMNLDQTITYNITTAPPQGFSITQEPLFVFTNVQTPGAAFFDTGSGSITFSVNGGPAQPLSVWSNSSGAVGLSNLFLTSSTNVPLNIGDVVTLSLGSFTGNSNFPIAPPASGAHSTYIAAFLTPGPAATRISDFGAPIPEPASTSLLIAGLGVLLYSIRKTRTI